MCDAIEYEHSQPLQSEGGMAKQQKRKQPIGYLFFMSHFLKCDFFDSFVFFFKFFKSLILFKHLTQQKCEMYKKVSASNYTSKKQLPKG